jgi:two-component system, OmpR family, response regulator ChvI
LEIVLEKVLIVEDEVHARSGLTELVESWGYRAECAADGIEGLEKAIAWAPAIIVTDLKMPRMDGMELLSRLRQTSSMPVIFLTSKDDELDELLGLRMGADDYITKPFSQRLLIERIRALLRREEHRSGNVGAEPGSVIERGDLMLDSGKHLCTWKGKPVPLTVTEFLLIKTLAQRPGHVKSRNQLIDTAYGEHIYVDDRTIDSHVKRVRRKFKEVDDGFNQIETLYGAGYRYKET